MCPEDVPLSNLFTELSELEQSAISGGFTAGKEKIYLSDTEDDFVDKYNTVTAYNSTQVSVIEDFSIDNSLNNLLGSSTFSLNVDSTVSSSILISGESSPQEVLNSDILNPVPTHYKQEVKQLLDNNHINNFALSITHYSANIQGTETFNISGSAGDITTSSSWSLNVDTAAISGIFLPQKSSTLDVSNLVSANNKLVKTQLLDDNTNITNFGLSFTYYSADFQQTELSNISGLSGSAIASSTQSVSIDTESLSGIFLSQQVSTPFMLSGLDRKSSTDIGNQNVSNNFIINDSLGSSDNLLLSLNTYSGLTGSQAGLSAFWKSETTYVDQKQSDINGLLENNFGDRFGFSTSDYNAENHHTKFYLLSGNLGSTEELVNSILGITSNDVENIQFFSSAPLNVGLSSNRPITTLAINTSLNSGLDSQLTEFNSPYTVGNSSYSGMVLDNLSGVGVIDHNNLNGLLGSDNLTWRSQQLDKSSIGLSSGNLIEINTFQINTLQINKFENLQGLTSKAVYPEIIDNSGDSFTFLSPTNTFMERNSSLELQNGEIGNYTFFKSNIFNFNSTNYNIGSIEENSTNNLSSTFNDEPVTRNISGQSSTINHNFMPSMFLLFAVNNSGNSILALEKHNIAKIANNSQANSLNSVNKTLINK